MDEDVENFCSITNCSSDAAVHYLESCDGNLEAAIALYFQQQCDNDEQASTSRSSEDTREFRVPYDGEVREPIGSKSGVLVEETFHNSYAPSRRHRTTNSIFDRSRDFEAETKAREASIFGNKKIGDASASTGSKLKTLEALFRPPTEIMHCGTFETAKDAATTQERWLLVNVQDQQEFSCQVLNRDVWNNSAVQELVANNFVLWQIYNNSAEGRRFETYYRVESYPFVAILDPRTGEMLASLNTSDPLSFCDRVTTFMESRGRINQSGPSFEITRPSSPDTASFASADVIQKTSFLSTNGTLTRKRLRDDSKNGKPAKWNVVSDDEDEKIEDEPQWKTRRLGAENNANGECSSMSNGVLRTNGDTKFTSDEWKKYVAPDGSTPDITLMFRLPDGSKRQLGVSKRATVQAILSYVENELGISMDEYELVLNFPTRRLDKQRAFLTLEELGFARQEIVYVS